MRRLLFTFCLFISSVLSIQAQFQQFSYSAVGKGVATTYVSDYQCLGINSSALGWGPAYDKKHFTTGSSEFAFSFYSDSLTSDKLKSLYQSVRGALSKNNQQTIDFQKQKESVANYAQAGVMMQFNYNWGGFAIQGKRLGGFAFNVREEYRWYSKLNQQTTDILFRGKYSSYFDSLQIVIGTDTSMIANSAALSQDTLNNVIAGVVKVPLNVSSITKGSEIKSSWNRSFNIGYGVKVFGDRDKMAVYIGAGARLIKSVAMFSLTSDDAGLRVSSSMSPNFNIDYGAIAGLNPSNFSEKGKLLPKAIGNGYGIDLSASVIFWKKIKVAMAINNLGSVTYKRNVYTVQDTLLTSINLSGISNSNITSSLNQLMSQGGLLRLQGKEKIVVANPSDLRLGASVHLGKVLSVGGDLVVPFNPEIPGSVKNTVIAFGGELRPLKFIALSAGYIRGGIYNTSIPMGVNFIFRDGAYEIGISSYDIYSLFSNNAHSVSAAFGFARVRF